MLGISCQIHVVQLYVLDLLVPKSLLITGGCLVEETLLMILLLASFYLAILVHVIALNTLNL